MVDFKESYYVDHIEMAQVKTENDYWKNLKHCMMTLKRKM